MKAFTTHEQLYELEFDHNVGLTDTSDQRMPTAGKRRQGQTRKKNAQKMKICARTKKQAAEDVKTIHPLLPSSTMRL